MKLILLSGGSGKRLWPLSNDSRSKQFLKVLKGPTGMESMVQRVWRQLDSVGLASSAVITTSRSQHEILRNQLGEHVPLIIEPMRRDTYPAIMLAVAYLYSEMNTPLDEAIVVLPVDPYVDNRFFERVKELEQVLHSSQANLALLGVAPTFPSEKYGYIVPQEMDNQKRYAEVSCFREKPTEPDAKELIERGALWNCGVFGFKLGEIIKLFERKGLPSSYNELHRQYASLPQISFDYEVVEKNERTVVLPYDGEWKDLGTWNTLTEEMDAAVLGNGLLDDKITNTHVVNELDIPIAVLGLSNVVVSASPDGILVSDKQASPRVKEMINHLKGRPMYEERRWGWHRILDVTQYPSGNQVLIKRVCIAESRNLSYHVHHQRDETWTVLEGTGLLAMSGNIREIRQGDVIRIPAGTEHAVKAVQTLEFLEVQSGNELTHEDTYRIHLEWSEIVKLCNREWSLSRSVGKG